MDILRPPALAQEAMVLFAYVWVSLAMLVAWLAKEVERKGWQRTSTAMLLVAGYGPFLSAVTFGSYIKEWQGAARTWDKTVKTGKQG